MTLETHQETIHIPSFKRFLKELSWHNLVLQKFSSLHDHFDHYSIRTVSQNIPSFTVTLLSDTDFLTKTELQIPFLSEKNCF